MISIKHAPGTCCPDYDCIHEVNPDKYTGKRCRVCGADCTKCQYYPSINSILIDLKLPGYLQGLQQTHYQKYIEYLIQTDETWGSFMAFCIFWAYNRNTEALIKGEWRSPEELQKEEALKIIDAGQEYVKKKYHNGVQI